MKILVTGAAGLLGRAVVNVLQNDFTVTGSYHTRAEAGLVQLDTDDPAAVDALIDAGGFSHIVHCAAIRSPEACLADPEKAYRANAIAPEYMARAANRTGAMLVHISTDYVFDGTKPPYHEDDRPNPVNMYGRTKLAGEFAAMNAERHLILRIPALYRTDLTDPRNAARQFSEMVKDNTPHTLDGETIRYYTLVEDIAAAIRFCLEQDVRGILHLSAEQKTTKADFARRVVRAIGKDPALIQDGPPVVTEDARPHDSHLCPDRYKSLGGPALRSIDEALADLSA